MMGQAPPVAPPILPNVSLQDVTIATVGTGVMAESMIAGLLQGREVDPLQIIASHPRAERRRAPARGRTASARSSPTREAIAGRGHDRAGHQAPDDQAGRRRAGRGAAPRAAGHQRHRRRHDRRLDQRPATRPARARMPNTPAQLGKGMTVWYATPTVSATQREQAAALLRQPGRRSSRSTTRSSWPWPRRCRGTGPDVRVPGHGGAHRRGRAPGLPAAHRPRPGHRDARRQHPLREGERHAPGTAAQHGHVARRHERGRASTSSKSGRLRTVLSEAVWAAYRRTDELGHQLEAETASLGDDANEGHRAD